MKHNTITIKDPKGDKFDPVDVLHRSYEKSFAFQKVFDTTCDQSRIHQETTSGLAEFVCRENHTSVFAYGATGSGKTYTMLGDRKNPGVIVRVLNDLFRDIGNKSVQMSYMEIYNETIRDLLVRRSKKLPLRAAGRGQVEVAGLTKTRVRTLSDAMHLLAEGTFIFEANSKTFVAVSMSPLLHQPRTSVFKVTTSGFASLVALIFSTRCMASLMAFC